MNGFTTNYAHNAYQLWGCLDSNPYAYPTLLGWDRVARPHVVIDSFNILCTMMFTQIVCNHNMHISGLFVGDMKRNT